MTSKINKHTGFTIVELLIVIVVIGILAAITIISFNNVQERARLNTATSDLRLLHKAIYAARINTDKTLLEITNNNCTRCATTPSFASSIDRLSTASGMNLSGLKKGDPWGNEYQMDENEGEQTANPCVADSISVLGKSSITTGGSFRINYVLPQCLNNN